MEEIEVKIIEIDRRAVVDRLASLGAIKVFDGDIESRFFDLPDGSIRKTGDLLRLRRANDRAILTYKKYVESDVAKVRGEHEVTVSDFEEMRCILELIGLTSAEGMTKHRTSYLLEEGVHVDIDKYVGEYSHIPEFMEIEAKNVMMIHEYARRLGFSAKDCRPWTTSDLIDYYSNKKGM